MFIFPMFYFNSEKYDFWKVYERISSVYPLGIPKGEGRMYFDYPGQQALQKLLVENIHDNEAYSRNWENFTSQLQIKFGKEIIGTTYGQAPCFSAFVVLSVNTCETISHLREIHFFVSLIGPFYTVIGQECTTIRKSRPKYQSTNCLVVSPEEEFAETFNALCMHIENRFIGYRFVPFGICQMEIKGLEVGYNHEPPNLIFHALFNDHINLNAPFIGNGYFKTEDWIREGWVGKEGGWSAYPAP